MTSEKPASISERLTGARVLVSGATGFLAKVLVEKILWAAPDVGRLYLLVRPRSDREPWERVRREVLGSAVKSIF